MGIFLRESALPGLKKYKYSSIDNSLVSKYVLKPFYTRFVNVFPLWLAPNLITLLGLLFTGISVVLVMIYNPNFDSEYPKLVYFVFALNLFLYQTFDACDGLQARRTNSSSPLGELFDHCVDAINTTLGVIVFSSVMNYSPLIVILALFSTTLNFYLSTWEEFHTGTLYLSVFSGPVEGVLILCIMDIITGFTGPQLWSEKRSYLFGLSMNDVSQPSLVVALLFNAYEAAKNVKKIKKGGSAELSSGILPFAALWVGVLAWINAAPYIVTQHLITFLLVFGLIFALLVGRLITAHVTQQSFPRFNVLLLVPFVGTFVHYVSAYFEKIPGSADIAFLYISLGFSFAIYGTFVAEIIQEITEYLDIGCLYIKYKSE